jgi:membrane-associated phospholipid phosphatase
MTETATNSATKSWPLRWIARLISTVFHPVALPLLTLGVLTYFAPGGTLGSALAWVVIAGVLSVLPVGLLVLIQVVRGEWTDTDVSVRRQRYLLYPYGIVSLLTAALAFAILTAPGVAVRATLGAVAANVVNMLINLRYKVSAHATTAAMCAVLLWLGTPAAVSLYWGGGVTAAALLVGWSRVALGRHTAGQVALGWTIGAAAGAASILIPWTAPFPLRVPLF